MMTYLFVDFIVHCIHTNELIVIWIRLLINYTISLFISYFIFYLVKS